MSVRENGMRRVEVCGGVASGKTTLCKLMGLAGWQTLFEDFRANPFWSSFYDDPIHFAFETEITFHLQHYSQIKTAVKKGASNIFCDFSLIQDLAYAKANLTAGALKTFECVYEQVSRELPAVSLLVHLQCDAEEELARIHHRARPEERIVGLEYLNAINFKIAECVKDANDTTKILVIDSKTNNFATDELTKSQIVASVSHALAS